MTTKNYNDVRRMMRKIAAISANLEKWLSSRKRNSNPRTCTIVPNWPMNWATVLKNLLPNK